MKFASILAAVVLVACDNGTPMRPEPPPTEDSISIDSIIPTEGTRLEAGKNVTFTGTLSYTLASAATGEIVIVIQDDLDHNLKPAGVPQESLTVMRGTGIVTLSDSVFIPTSGVSSVRVLFPLFPLLPGGTASTTIVATVSYPVSH